MNQKYDSIWAKTDLSNPETHRWLTLPQHLLDTRDFSRMVWKHLLPQKTKNMVKSIFMGSNIEKEHRAENLVAFLSGVHDIGKFTPVFQHQIFNTGYSWLVDNVRASYWMPDDSNVPKNSELSHALAGGIIMKNWIIDKNILDEKHALMISLIVGGHHGVFPSEPEIRTFQNYYMSNGGNRFFGNEQWKTERDNLIDSIYEDSKADFESIDCACLTASIIICLTGIVVLSDWLASGQVPLTESGNDEDPRRVTGAWNRLNLPSPWVPRNFEYDDFKNVFGFIPNEMQSKLFEINKHITDNEVPELVILESPMGSGKTEAAFMFAQMMSATFGTGGMSFSLPTMATSDSMLPRVADWVSGISDDNESIAELTSRAWMNPFIRQLRNAADDNAVIDSWLGKGKQSLMSSFIVSTIDQILMMGLRSRHFDLRFLGLVGKTVVIDEVHSSDAYMREILKNVLMWFGDMRIPVILMSATLKKSVREEFLSAYVSGKSHSLTPSINPSPLSYPLISTSENNGIYYSLDGNSEPKHVKVHLDAGKEPHDIIDDILDGEDKGNILLICNTVKQAQEEYAILSEKYTGSVSLLHSRFTASDRFHKEEELRRRYGKDNSMRPGFSIVVATQVAEQSLDIDFDVLVTEIAPIDLILQRIGRLHRHESNNTSRPKRFKVPNVHLFGWSLNNDNTPAFSKGTNFIYGIKNRGNYVNNKVPAYELLKTLSALRDRDFVSIPSEIPDLIEHDADAFDNEVADRSLRLQEADIRKLTDNVHDFLLKNPFAANVRSGRGLEGINSKNSPNSDNDFRSRTRFSVGNDGIKVIVVKDKGSGYVSMIGDEAFLPMGQTPDVKTSFALMRQTVSLPGWMSTDEVISLLEEENTKMFSAWQENNIIKGSLVLLLDSDGYAIIGDNRLHYDNERGLTCEHIKKEGE